MRVALGFLLAVALAGCKQAPDAPVPCVADAGCPGGYHCGPKGVCVGDIPCLVHTDCCLAERCMEGRCRPRSMCSPSAPCGKPASRCLQGMCVPQTCAADGDCPADRPCRLGVCRQTTPCDGHCATGQACSPLLDRCVALHPGTAAPACPEGTLALLANDSQHFGEGCSDVPQQVVCGELPALPAGDLGWPSVLVDRKTELGLIARDRTYGDVVLALHGRSPPYLRSATIPLAGLPVDAPVVGDPGGPRGGVAAPGPDTGRILDANSRSDGTIDVAYRDDSADGVGFLRVVGKTAVARHLLVQGAGVGEGLAVAAQPGGQPLIATFTPAPSAGGTSALRLFTAKNINPTTADDWQDVLIDSQALPKPALPCGGSCAGAHVCARVPGVDGGAAKDACVMAGKGCALCLPSQVCFEGACIERRLPPPQLVDLAHGRGVHLDLMHNGDGVHLAAYSRNSGDVAFYTPKPGGGHTTTVVGGDAVPGGSADLGRFVRLVAAPGGGVQAYCQDSAGGRLLRIRPGPTPQVVVIDDGIRSDGHHRVGADLAVVDTGAGALLLAYQDTRSSEAVVASVGSDGKPGARIELATDGAGGFSPSVVMLGSKAMVVATASLRFDGAATLRTSVDLRSVVMSGL